jgi:hypothetical protein
MTWQSTATQTLYDYLTNKKAQDLPSRGSQKPRAQCVDQGDGEIFRLTKENQKRKIDACVALSFVILGAIRNGRPMDLRALKTYRR